MACSSEMTFAEEVSYSGAALLQTRCL